jgi:ribonucleotide monophosphatase NagD (HAD superfamily)
LETLKNNLFSCRPYIFVTNGGGKTEEERCLDLSRQLEIEVSPGQFVCGHTPMRDLAETYKTVLVVGGEGEKCRTVAEGYGFEDVITPGDIIKDNMHTTPFRQLTSEEDKNSRLRNHGEVEIGAVFVFADSRDWAGDQQIIEFRTVTECREKEQALSAMGPGPIPCFAASDDRMVHSLKKFWCWRTISRRWLHRSRPLRFSVSYA